MDDHEFLIKNLAPNIEKVMEMIIKNIFLKINHININDNISDLSVADTAVTTNSIIVYADDDLTWPHIQGIFNIFYKLIIKSYIVEKLHVYIDKAFITKVIKCFKLDFGII